MKRILTALMAFVLIVGCFAGCSENLNRTYNELDAMAAELPLVITGYKLRPGKKDGTTGAMLQPIFQNKSDKTITDLELAVATWDARGIPVCVTFADGKLNTENITKVTYSDWEIAAGATCGKDGGLALSSDSIVPERIQAIPVRWTYADGTVEENPNYKYWENKYLNKNNTRADLPDPQFEVEVQTLSAEELAEELKKQPLVVTECNIGQWEQGDLLCAKVKNNGEATIKSMLLAYATFDAEGNPVCITWSDGEKAESNVVKIRMKDLALAYGGEYGADKGVGLHADSDKVASFLAIPYYYEDIDGNTWENPWYDSWLSLYEVE
jgi:hypothetical protein